MQPSPQPKNHPENIWIVIPAYNEATQISSVISNLRKQGYQNILVVDDGSKDTTGKLAREGGVEVLTLLINRGQGCALKAGFDFLLNSKHAEIAVTFDADGQHNPADIEKLVRPIQEDRADIVLGSRFLQKNNVPFLRRCLLQAGILFTNSLSRIKLTDTHNGLRALNKKALEKIEIIHRGMEHASDIIDEISMKKLRYLEAPVTILYTDYSMRKGQKTSNFIKMGLKIILKKILS